MLDKIDKIPLFRPDYGEEELEAIGAVLKSGWLTAGEQVALFEREFARSHGVSSAVAVGNCTAALHLAMQLGGIGPGDEVIVPSLTFVATASCVCYTGARPVFADIASLSEPHITAQTIEEKLTPQTRAVIVVHYAGYPVAMDDILDLAERRGLIVVEDAAHGPGRDGNGRWLGTMGHFGCFSFYGNKNLCTGEGGMLLCRNPGDLEKARLLRSHGMTASPLEREKGRAFGYDIALLGYNYRFDELRAAIGRIQLKKLSEFHEKRKQAVLHYRRLLADRPDMLVPFADRLDGSFHIMPILLPEGTDPLEAMKRLRRRGVSTSRHYPPVHQLSAFRSGRHGRLPITEVYGRRVLTLPLYPGLTEGQISRIVSELGLRHENGFAGF